MIPPFSIFWDSPQVFRWVICISGDPTTKWWTQATSCLRRFIKSRFGAHTFFGISKCIVWYWILIFDLINQSFDLRVFNLDAMFGLLNAFENNPQIIWSLSYRQMFWYGSINTEPFRKNADVDDLNELGIIWTFRMKD